MQQQHRQLREAGVEANASTWKYLAPMPCTETGFVCRALRIVSRAAEYPARHFPSPFTAMQLNRFTDLGLRVLMYLTHRDREQPVTISEIAERFEVSRNHLVKVVHFMGCKAG
jgi:hypothetical protein